LKIIDTCFIFTFWINVTYGCVSVSSPYNPKLVVVRVAEEAAAVEIFLS